VLEASSSGSVDPGIPLFAATGTLIDIRSDSNSTVSSEYVFKFLEFRQRLSAAEYAQASEVSIPDGAFVTDGVSRATYIKGDEVHARPTP
jgi:hypothetical protein